MNAVGPEDLDDDHKGVQCRTIGDMHYLYEVADPDASQVAAQGLSASAWLGSSWVVNVKEYR